MLAKGYLYGLSYLDLFWCVQAIAQEVGQDRLQAQEAGNSRIRTEESPVPCLSDHLRPAFKGQGCQGGLLTERCGIAVEHILPDDRGEGGQAEQEALGIRGEVAV